MKLIALVGKPNVGKSTLFNRLVGRRQAIVGAEPGVTRDRNISLVQKKGLRYLLMDTGGFEPEAEEGIETKMREQSRLAVEEAEIILFVLDRQSGLTEQDREIYQYLRSSQKPLYLLVNKTDGDSHEADLGEFYELGAADLFAVSGEHGRGLGDLLERLAEDHPDLIFEEDEDARPEEIMSIALLGRPNAGKSSLANAILGENRLIVHHEAGTTRDPVDQEFRFQGNNLRLIDTAGLKRKARVSQQVDHYSMVGSIRSIERCDIGLLVIDATAGVVEQDARIAGYIVERGRGLVVVVNKWDLIEKDSKTLKKMEQEIRDQLNFIDWAPILFVSALNNQRVPKLLEKALEVYEQYCKRVKTADLNRILEEVTLRHNPPGKRGRRTKIYYGTQVSIRPPSFVFHTNDPTSINQSYHRFMSNQLRQYFGFEGTPIHLFWRDRSGNKKNEDPKSEPKK
ncbi:MAG: ribosome biogenesis GTPase Der [Candidatus Lambdaproteobacteria bacterium RIFOXYD2_FULL_50_16]|uniref:GTPase Der n=1 Tax=Candidatus Lambdaproteobacteria bacterium RIFOXYD2_FULL_50_16 TaxID=1817772 RepID=A0A1F6GD32_9PROT|nr:MAG: ribosome biogenesis GTPase Der [Candidatus Lambdaproteobacteria bacterium RIFOXYD2_FULL_50_16]